MNVRFNPVLLTSSQTSLLTHCEGTTSAARRIGAIVLGILASLVSFAFLPFQSALVLSAIAITISLACGFLDCSGERIQAMDRGLFRDVPVIINQPAAPQVPFFRRVFNWIPLRRNVLPIDTTLPRVPVGDANPPHARNLYRDSRRDDYLNVPQTRVAFRGPIFRANDPPVQQPIRRPVRQRNHHFEIPQNFQGGRRRTSQPHVPVGRRHH